MDTSRSANVNHRRLDDLRRGRGPVEEHVIDEFVAGRLSRRDFLRRGSMVGLSMPLLGGILAACGSSTPSGSKSPGAGKAGPALQARPPLAAAAPHTITTPCQGRPQPLGNVVAV